ncbi:hypothetical protein ILUMI_16200 [Ignelater luminosus]|uniref:Uncharacterized protein n=1 Tax=Ignelater luminosus TaxID=2038154 RepID=A0A8K0CM79_IGNLU|nr:hypothetical protein ILUMI_16200 [Ignelater luminosus]
MTNDEFDQMFDVPAVAGYVHRRRTRAPQKKKKNKRQRARQAASREAIPETITEDTADFPSPVPLQLARMEFRPSSAAVITIIRRGRATAGIRRALALVLYNVCSQHGSRAHRRRLQGNQPLLPEEPPSTVRGSTATGPYG